MDGIIMNMSNFKAVIVPVLFSLAMIQSAPAFAEAKPTFSNDVKTSLAKSIGAEENSVDVSIAGGVVKVLRINSNQNNSSHAGRNNEASQIAQDIAKIMSSDANFADIVTIRIEYLSREKAEGKSMVIDVVEFRKNSKGAFQLHIT
jgi:hypothetical protein